MTMSRIGGFLLACLISVPAYAGGRGHGHGHHHGYGQSHGHKGGGWGFGHRYHRHKPHRHNNYNPIEVAPENMSIAGFSFSGEGCNGAMASVSPDSQQLEVLYPNFFAAHTGSSPSAGFESESSNCRARIRMNVPAGYQFAVVSGTGRGQAILDAQSRGEFSVRHGFNIFSHTQGVSKLTIPGPYSNNYEHSFDMPLRAVTWSSCDSYQRDLVVDTSITVRTKGNSSGVMTVDSSDYNVDQEYGLVWRQCKDRTRAYIAVCRASYSSGGELAEVQAHAKARTLSEALSRAQDRALDRCEDKSGGAMCTTPVNACQTQAI